MKKYIYIYIFMFSFLCADDKEWTYELYSKYIIEGNGGAGLYTAPNREHKLSELIWNTDDITVYGLRLSKKWENPKHLTEFKIESNLTDQDSGIMTDSDWTLLNHPSIKTHYTISNIECTRAQEIEMKHKYCVFSDEELFHVSVLGGMKRSSYAWRALNYYGYYSSNYVLDTAVGSSEPCCNYKQTWIIPYMGLLIEKPFHWGSVSAEFSYSPFVVGQSQDDHLLRNLRSKNTVDSASYSSFVLRSDYQVKEGLSCFAEISGQTIEEKKGTLNWIDFDEPENNFSLKNGESMFFDQTAFTLGLNFNF